MILRALPILALALAAPPAQARTSTILPGYWESTSTSYFIIRSKPKTERRCLTPDKVEQYLTNPSTSHYHCNYSRKAVGDGKVEFVGQCFDKHHNAFDVAIHGDYAPEAFHVSAHFSPTGLPIGGSATTTAHRLGDCPASE